MKIFSADAVLAWEQATIRSQHLTPAALMERAAHALFLEIQQHVGEKATSFLILCGFGNNGGDGLALGRMLHEVGHPVTVYRIEHHAYSEENQINESRLRALGITIQPLFPESNLRLEEGVFIIDALFGYGLSRPLDVRWKRLIDQVNTASNSVFAVDIPSGLFADRPTPTAAPVIQASKTYTFASPKLSLLLPDYASFTGTFQILNIGLDKDIYSKISSSYHYTLKEEIQQILRPLQKFSHKGTYGHTYIVGGRYGSIGAIVLACRAALTTGCGLVTAYMPTCGYTVLQSAFPEAQVQTDPFETHLSMFPRQLTGYQAIGVGMGMGTQLDTERAFHQFLKRFGRGAEDPALLLDADAINLLARNPSWQTLLPPNSILTPHPKELQRLIGPWQDDFEKLKKVCGWSQQYQQIVVVKGAHSAVVLPDGTVHFNSSGNPGMATAGSGDVLSGIISSLLAQGYTAPDAARLGTYLHGLAGDIAATGIHPKSMTAGTIIAHLSDAWNALMPS